MRRLAAIYMHAGLDTMSLFIRFGIDVLVIAGLLWLSPGAAVRG